MTYHQTFDACDVMQSSFWTPERNHDESCMKSAEAVALNT